MAGLGPAIHAFLLDEPKQVADPRAEPGMTAFLCARQG